MSIKQKIVCLLILVPYAAFAKSGSVNYSWGADALATMHDFVVTVMLYVLYICYSIASVLVIVSAFQIYIKMTTAPVVGSGSWPAWMARVAMSVLANLALYSADMILGSFRDRSVFEGRTGTGG